MGIAVDQHARVLASIGADDDVAERWPASLGVKATSTVHPALISSSALRHFVLTILKSFGLAPCRRGVGHECGTRLTLEMVNGVDLADLADLQRFRSGDSWPGLRSAPVVRLRR